MHFRYAIFDMDGTLLDSMWAWRRLLPDLLEDARIPLTDALQAQLSSMMVQETVPFLRAHYQLPWTPEEVHVRFLTRMEAFYRTDARPKSGVPEYLARLQTAGVKLFVASATNRPLVETALRSTGLMPYFQGILTSPEVGSSKRESGEIYEQALAQLGGSKEETVVFEDALYAIQTAKRSGFRVCAVFDAAEPAQADAQATADYYIRSFEELPMSGF